MFDSADQDSSGTLDEEKVIKLIKELNTGLQTIKVKQKLKVSVHSNQEPTSIATRTHCPVMSQKHPRTHPGLLTSKIKQKLVDSR